MKQHNLRVILLTICSISYLLVGAAIFSALEYEDDQKRRKELRIIEKNLQKTYNISDSEMKRWRMYLNRKPNLDAKLEQWSFAGAVYFATTVLTTIGYGHTVPETVRGKTFCMIYASIGIPLTLTMFQAIGERLNAFLAFMFRRMKRRLGMKENEASNTTNLVVLCGLCSMVITVSSGAFIFMYFEKWDYFHSFYYCFITVTTIGFGDYVALQDSKVHLFSEKYVGLSLLFIFFGLTIVGSVMNQLAMRLLTASQHKDPTEHLIHGGPRCDKCSLTTMDVEHFDDFEPAPDYSTTLLRNYEEEITFSTYKTLQHKRASI